VFVPEGRTPEAGVLFRNADLARTYRLLGEQGRDAFYLGDIARRMVSCSERHNGALSAADLAAYDAEWVTPLSTTYRGWTVYELPPNGQGIAALMMLNLIEHSPMAEFGHNSAEALHTLIEAKKLAYADMARHVCDPAFNHVPSDAMLSKAYAASRVAAINADRANPEVSPGALPKGSDTTYLSVVDRDGNMVSLIQSNFANFGSGVVPDGTGFALQSRGGLFTTDPSHPNALAPRKRPLHTIIPGFMTGRVRRPESNSPSGDEVKVAFGIMGGWNQSQAHVQFISNVIDHGMNIQAALEAPRVTKLTFTGCDVLMESRVPVGARLALTARGHQIDVQGPFSSLVGGGQSVMRNYTTGVNYGASDPRKDGAAIPEIGM
jgi:gamma-glutamyltranspeptidase/glutathione hydrolase